MNELMTEVFVEQPLALLGSAKDWVNLSKSYGDLTELVDLAYLWSFIRKDRHAACEVGLF